MKKIWLAAGLSVMLSYTAYGATDTPLTLTERMDSLDKIVYGQIGDGSLVNRVDAADEVIYGKGKKAGEGLDERVIGLYDDVVKNNDDTKPSLSMRVNALEYYLADSVTLNRLETRVGELEAAVYGKEKTGALMGRVSSLENTIYGDRHYEMKDVSLPKDTVFKIALNEDVSSKTNQVGDPVTFTVEQDVLVGDVIVLPRGAQGSGVITKVTPPKSFGRSGALDISFDQVFSIDGESIPTVLGPESREKLKMEAAAVGASVVGALALGPIGLVGGFFVKGKDVSLPSGSELYIQTEKEVTTKGMVLADGAAEAVMSDEVSASAVVAVKNDSDADVSAREETTEKKSGNEAKKEASSGDDVKVTVTGENQKSNAADQEESSVVVIKDE